MPDSDRKPRATQENTPSDELLLAAVERAARHRARGTSAVPSWAITDHLGLPRRSGAARRTSARLAALHAAGALERSRQHGMTTWELTPRGRRRLRDARRAGTLVALHEAPQHRAWRNARSLAAQEIERFHDDLRRLLHDALPLLDTEPAPPSDAWFDLAESLHKACRRLGSASYCLHEWAEPDDDSADVDQATEVGDERLAPDERARKRALRAGRRSVWLWRDPREA